MRKKNIAFDYIDSLNYNFLNTKVTNFKGKEIELNDGLIKSAEMIVKTNEKGGKVMFIGNGGSAAVSSHKALDFWFTGKIKGMVFFDYSSLTAISNDFGYQNVYSKQIERFAEKNDLLIAISSSGESKNIIYAVKKSRDLDCKIITFSGFKKTNSLRKLGDLNFFTPSSHYNQVESIDLLLCDCILEIILKNRKNIKYGDK